MKPIHIRAEKYLQDQLDTLIVKQPLEDILKQIEKQIPMNHTCTHKYRVKNTQNGTHKSDTQQESITTNTRDNIGQMNRRVNNGQKDSVNSMPLNRNSEESSQKSYAHTRTRCRRII